MIENAHDPVERALIRAGEREFATHGVRDVTDLSILAAAPGVEPRELEARYGDRTGLLRAIVARHQIPVDARRNRLLDEIDPTPPVPVRPVVEAVVHPLADKLHDPHGGREYLTICSQLRRDNEHFIMLLDGTTGITRAVSMLTGGNDHPVVDHYMMLVSSMLLHGLADQVHDDRGENAVFVAIMVDAMCALIESALLAMGSAPTPAAATPVG